MSWLSNPMRAVGRLKFLVLEKLSMPIRGRFPPPEPARPQAIGTASPLPGAREEEPLNLTEESSPPVLLTPPDEE